MLKNWLLFFIVCYCSAQETCSKQIEVGGVGKVKDIFTWHVTPTCKQHLTNNNSQLFLEIKSNQEYWVQLTVNGTKRKRIKIDCQSPDVSTIYEERKVENLDEVVVSGTLKPVRRLETAIPVEIISQAFLKQNPTSNLLESLGSVPGLRAQNNCNVCNTGDIRINGLDGPYTMVTIDGMPIVSALGTVYGLSGIPTSIIDRIEVVKGAASTLYGSEAVAGLLNIITKKPENSARYSADSFTTSWFESSLDISQKAKIGKSIQLLHGLSVFRSQNPKDVNHDGFTDSAVTNRISFFQKGTFNIQKEQTASWMLRYLYEDRWGGQMNWTPQYRGGNQIYGESIYTNRWEWLSMVPLSKKTRLQSSLIGHYQDAAYGVHRFLAKQHIAFAQLLHDWTWNKHQLLGGIAMRWQDYKDNAPIQSTIAQTTINSLFMQDDWNWNQKTGAVLGMRLDYHSAHGYIYTPRMAIKWKPSPLSVLRWNIGTGFRVVNVFSEDHQALSGGRTVTFEGTLKPETSYNTHLNYLLKKQTSIGLFVWENALWYTYFTHRIQADYDSNPNLIIYSNANGYNQIQGCSSQLDWISTWGLKATVSISFYDATMQQNNERKRPLFSEKYNGTWNLTYTNQKGNWTIDYNGSLVGPMRLPLLSATDPRRSESLPYSIQNIQMTYRPYENWEIYGGIKNLLNWTPAKENPFLIARSNDPFDQQVQWNAQGQIMAAPNNPYGLSFDPTYAYAPNQGARVFIGCRMHID
ncbi:MAG: TonB-dependent receptor [Flavobacterium sp. BFFFF2]|nr:MAG: TonB-dependent receptor [Flavobacterium sp. BFFFF2]